MYKLQAIRALCKAMNVDDANAAEAKYITWPVVLTCIV